MIVSIITLIFVVSTFVSYLTMLYDFSSVTHGLLLYPLVLLLYHLWIT